MNKILQISVLFCLSTLTISAKPLAITGSENHRAYEIGAVAPFHTLHVNGQTEVDVLQSSAEEYTVSLYGPENLIDLVQIDSQDGTLSIQYKKPVIILGDHHLRILVTTPKLSKLHVQEKGEVNITGIFQTEELNIVATGKTEIDIEHLQAASVRVEAKEEAEVDVAHVDCQSLHVETDQHASFEVQRITCPVVMLLADNRSDISLSALSAQSVTAQSNHTAEIELKGKTLSAALTARDRSSIEAGSLQAEKADVMAANGSFIDVRVSDTLNAQTETRAKVQYRGWPKEINRSGKGLVRKNS